MRDRVIRPCSLVFAIVLGALLGWAPTLWPSERLSLAPGRAAAAGLSSIPNPNIPTTNGVVRAIARGPDGTTYIGGGFTTVGVQPRWGIAALDASGNLTPFNPGANGTVYALAVSGSTIYIGGAFTLVGGQPRDRIAALDLSGNLTAFTGDASGTVYALAVSGSTVFAGGAFRTIEGQARNRLAELDASGNVTAFNPNASGVVYALSAADPIIYVGGSFTTIGGQPRGRIAALDHSGTVTAFNPVANRTVYALAASGPTVYIGGTFSSVGGQNRSCIAAVDTSGGVAALNPGADGTVFSIATSGPTIFAGGSFGAVGGLSRSRLAALDGSGNLLGFDVPMDNRVYAILPHDSNLYVGGIFSSVGGAGRQGLARFDLDDVAPTTQVSIVPARPDGGAGWYVTRPRITLTADEPGTTTYRWDTGSWVTQPGRVTFGCPKGTHVLEYYSCDTVANTETVHNLVVRNRAPSVTLSRPLVVPSGPSGARLFRISGYLKPWHPGTTELFIFRKVRGRWRAYRRVLARNAAWSAKGGSRVTRYLAICRLHLAGRYCVWAYHADVKHYATYSPARVFNAR